jgi:hypothetical protein
MMPYAVGRNDHGSSIVVFFQRMLPAVQPTAWALLI